MTHPVASRLRSVAALSEKGVAFMSDTDLAEETMEEVALLHEAANALTHLGLAAETVVLAWHLAAHHNIPPELHAALSDLAGVVSLKASAEDKAPGAPGLQSRSSADASSEGSTFEGLPRETLESLYMGALETIAELEARLPASEVTNEPGTSWDIADGVLRIRRAP